MGIHELKQNLSFIIRQTLEKYYESNNVRDKLLWFADEGIEEANPNNPLKRLKGQYVINFTAEDINNREVAFEARCNENKSSYSCDLLKEYDKYRNAGCYNSPGFTVLDHTDTHIDFGKDIFEEDIEWVDVKDAADADTAAEAVDQYEVSYDAEVCKDAIEDILPESIAEVEEGEITDVKEDGDVALEEAIPDVTLDAPADEATEDTGGTPIVNLGVVACTNMAENLCFSNPKVPQELKDNLSTCLFFEKYSVNGIEYDLENESPMLADFLDPGNEIEFIFGGNNLQPAMMLMGMPIKFEPVDWTEDFENEGKYIEVSWRANMFGTDVATIDAAEWEESLKINSFIAYGVKTCLSPYNFPCGEKDEQCE